MSSGKSDDSRLVPVDFDPFAAGEVVTMVPATAAQREIWASVQMEAAASLAFNECLLLRLRGPLDGERLRAAYHELLLRHGALRGTFTPDGVWLCISSATPDLPPLVDWTALPPSEQEAHLGEEARHEVDTVFDLVHGPLVRARLFRLSSEEHVLLLTAHHIVCDGWSHAVILDELAALYSGRGLPPAASFERYASDDMNGQEDEQYWLARFADGAPTLDLPTDRPRPRARTYASARVDCTLPEGLVTDLQALGARHGASLTAILLAGYAAFLHRLTSQESMVIGVPAAGQARTGQDHLVGHCVSLLPVRLSVRSDQRFCDLLSDVRLTFLEALDHQRPSFGRLLEKLKLTRDPARIPLVSTVFNMDRSPASLDFSGLQATCASVPRSCETFELFIYATHSAGRLQLSAQYNTNLFEASTIQRRLAELQTLLTSAAANPEASIVDLDLLPEDERQRLLVEFNRNEVDYRPPGCLQQLFERQADLTPDRIAVTASGCGVTYRELEERANRVAHRLRALGAGPGVLVGVYAERSIEMVVAIYGVLKAGAAYLPLEPSDPPERLTYLLSDAQPRVLVAQAAVAERLPTTSIAVLPIDAEVRSLLDAPTDRPSCAGGPEDPAYVIYTSGSTGRPKGVVNLHRGILNRILWMMERFGSAAEERVLQKTPYNFDVSLWELFWPLASGGRLVMAPPKTHHDPVRLAEIISDAQITMVHFVPSMLHAFLEFADLERCRSVRRVLSSGEALPFELQERFFQRWGVELHNLYGPTEAAVEVSHWQCRAGDPLGFVPIGRPIANTRLYVVDGRGRPTPIGVSGELLIGGVQVARGYLGKPDLTAERFIADPFSQRPEDRVYRTGDRACFLETGEVQYLGRFDDQLKVRGLRIEPGEIENALTDHPGVRQAAVRAVEPRPGDVRLVAFYVLSDPSVDVSMAELRKHLRGRLPEYMIPQQLVPVPKLPTTPSGKIDRKSLAVPLDVEVGMGARTPPRTPAEHLLSKVWAELIGIPVENIGVGDNFFDLGGHSLLALQAVARVAARTRVRLEPKLLILSSLEQVATLLTANDPTGELKATAAPEQAGERRQPAAG